MEGEAPAGPADDEYAPDFGRYIRLVPAGDILDILDAQLDEALALLSPLDEAASLAIHPPYAWTLKHVVGHVTDCERIFGYRALRLARNDPTPLATFDESRYMQFVDFNAWPIGELVEEFALVMERDSPRRHGGTEKRGTMTDECGTKRGNGQLRSSFCAHRS